jgi:hypothetical protein
LHLIGPIFIILGIFSTIGSNNGVVTMSSTSGLIFVFGLSVHGLLVRSVFESASLLPASWGIAAACVIAVCSAQMVGQSASSPFGGEGPLANRTSLVSFPGLGRLFLTPVKANYVARLRGVIASANPSEAKCVVVLASDPLASLVLDNPPPGSPWLIGGTPGWNASSKFALEKSGCRSDRFIVVDAPGSTSKVDWAALGSVTRIRTLGKIPFSADEVHVISVVQRKPRVKNVSNSPEGIPAFVTLGKVR